MPLPDWFPSGYSSRLSKWIKAGCLLIVSHRFQFGPFHQAALLSFGAPRREGTPRRQVYQIRGLAFDGGKTLRLSIFQTRDGLQERPRIGMGGPGKQLARGRLLND